MEKQPFTSDGVNAKQSELYALSDTDLQTQANLISSDFRSWISSNFALTADQSSYLTAMDTGFLKHSGAVTGTAVSHRLPISITIPGRPTVFSSKYAVIKDLLVPKYDSTGGFTVVGSVGFEIGYNQ